MIFNAEKRHGYNMLFLILGPSVSSAWKGRPGQGLLCVICSLFKQQCITSDFYSPVRKSENAQFHSYFLNDNVICLAGSWSVLVSASWWALVPTVLLERKKKPWKYCGPHLFAAGPRWESSCDFRLSHCCPGMENVWFFFIRAWAFLAPQSFHGIAKS